jgi:Glycosyltransferase family 87
MNDQAVRRPRVPTLELLGFAAAVIGILLAIALIPNFVRLATTDGLSDVRAYYDAATRLNGGQPLYDLATDVNASEFYRYPPLLAILFRPLALLPFGVAAAIWESLMVVAFIHTLRLLGLRRPVLFALGILAFPITWSLLLGQAQVAVTWMLAVATPWSVALAGQLKLFPALAALYWIGRRDWASVRRFAAWSIGLIAVQIALEPTGSFAFLGIANLNQVGLIDNLSPYGISPLLWAGLALLGAAATVVFARRSFGWAIAVAYSVLVTPRLLFYLLMALLACTGRPSTAARGVPPPGQVPAPDGKIG